MRDSAFGLRICMGTTPPRNGGLQALSVTYEAVVPSLYYGVFSSHVRLYDCAFKSCTALMLRLMLRESPCVQTLWQCTVGTPWQYTVRELCRVSRARCARAAVAQAPCAAGKVSAYAVPQMRSVMGSEACRAIMSRTAFQEGGRHIGRCRPCTITYTIDTPAHTSRVGVPRVCSAASVRCRRTRASAASTGRVGKVALTAGAPWELAVCLQTLWCLYSLMRKPRTRDATDGKNYQEARLGRVLTCPRFGWPLRA